ncbi:hypothetical protein [Streptomyces sp. BK340]|uniref:hypothetical protein n=1 Tax=Streptomyces sp. BK340 TaxID=2572903 RepID=UPI0011A2EE6F|nr:hypothetical protein [Streptomyces sp. BK340]TVZ76737.1 hypothetical protein FB157_14217 [Streptomyces sp. BK340]
MKRWSYAGLFLAASLGPVLGLLGGSDASASEAADVNVTFYGAADNDPGGSTQISNPSVHDKAGGTGTFDDPITFAAGEGSYQPGTKIYYPALKKYFVMEDSCADCGANHVDLYMGSANDDGIVQCEQASTKPGEQSIVVDPDPDLPVDSTPLYDGSCHAGGSTGETSAKSPAAAKSLTVGVPTTSNGEASNNTQFEKP